MNRFRRYSLAAAVLAAPLALACSESDTDPTPTAGPSRTAETPTEESRIAEFPVTATDFAYETAPEVPAGLVRFHLENAGNEPHQAGLFRINDGITDEQFESALASPDPAGILGATTALGGPNTVDSGAEQDVLAELEPGRYVWLCFVPSADDGLPHIAKGMVQRFDVVEAEPGSEQPAVPETDASMQLTEFSFSGSEQLAAGPQLVEVDNGGEQIHELTVMRLEEGETLDGLLARLAGEDGAPAPHPQSGNAGGVTGIAPGTSAFVEMNLEAGRYALICFVPDAATRKPHFLLGMAKELRVR